MSANPQELALIDLHAAVRLGVVESDITHIKTDVGELRNDVRELRSKIDQCALRSDLLTTNVAITDFGKKVDRHFLWLVSFQLGSVGILLGTMAHGFKWI